MFVLLESQSNDDNTIPSMDGNNKNMLDEIYANMDPSKMGSNNSDSSDQSACEIR